jgi:hypothetical protein
MSAIISDFRKGREKMATSKAKKVKRQIAKSVAAEKVPELIKLDIACGQRKEQGWTGIDIGNFPGVDIVHDLMQFPWPIKDGTVGEIRCMHYFEHVPGKLRGKFMEEVYRILVVGGKARFTMPYWASMRAIQDPTHEWPPIAESSFLYFNKDWKKASQIDLIYPYKCDFDFSYGYGLDNDSQFITRNDETKQFAVRNYNNVVGDLIVDLTKREWK